MTLFATGFYNINEEDTKKFKESSSGLELNNYYSKIQYICSLTCFVSIIVLGFYGFIVFLISFSCETILSNIIIVIIISTITLFITICGAIEYTVKYYVFEMTSDVPKDFSSHQSEMKSRAGNLHLWPYLAFLIIQVPFYYILYKIYRQENPVYSPPSKESKKEDKEKNNSDDEEKDEDEDIKDHLDPFYKSSDYKYNPKPETEMRQYENNYINENIYDKNSQYPSYKDFKDNSSHG